MPPVAAPATSFSARMHACASRARPSSEPASPMWKTSSSATATAHSSAAEEDSPAPYGTHESTAASNPPIGTRALPAPVAPACAMAHATPAA